jgi:hypothetical protein
MKEIQRKNWGIVVNIEFVAGKGIEDIEACLET